MIDQTDLQLRFDGHTAKAARVNREARRRLGPMPRGASGRWAIAATTTSVRLRVRVLLSWIGATVVRGTRRHQLAGPSLVSGAERQPERAHA